MPKLKLNPSPTFAAKVTIPSPEPDPQVITFTFRHKTKKELEEWATSEASKERGDAETVMGIATGWDLEEPMNAETLATLFQNYHASARTIVDEYMRALTQARLGN